MEKQSTQNQNNQINPNVFNFLTALNNLEDYGLHYHTSFRNKRGIFIPEEDALSLEGFLKHLDDVNINFQELDDELQITEAMAMRSFEAIQGHYFKIPKNILNQEFRNIPFRGKIYNIRNRIMDYDPHRTMNTEIGKKAGRVYTHNTHFNFKEQLLLDMCNTLNIPIEETRRRNVFKLLKQIIENPQTKFIVSNQYNFETKIQRVNNDNSKKIGKFNLELHHNSDDSYNIIHFEKRKKKKEMIKNVKLSQPEQLDKLNLAELYLHAKKGTRIFRGKGLKTTEELFIFDEDIDLLKKITKRLGFNVDYKTIEDKFKQHKAVTIEENTTKTGYLFELSKKRLAELEYTPFKPRNVDMIRFITIFNPQKEIDQDIELKNIDSKEKAGIIYTNNFKHFVKEKALVGVSHLIGKTNRYELFEYIKNIIEEPITTIKCKNLNSEKTRYQGTYPSQKNIKGVDGLYIMYLYENKFNTYTINAIKQF